MVAYSIVYPYNCSQVNKMFVTSSCKIKSLYRVTHIFKYYQGTCLHLHFNSVACAEYLIVVFLIEIRLTP